MTIYFVFIISYSFNINSYTNSNYYWNGRAEDIVYIDRENLTFFHIKLQFLSILASCFIQIRSKIDLALRIFSSRSKYKAEMVPNLNEPYRDPKSTICRAVQKNKIFKPSERISPPESFWPDSRQLFIPDLSRLC